MKCELCYNKNTPDSYTPALRNCPKCDWPMCKRCFREGAKHPCKEDTEAKDSSEYKTLLESYKNLVEQFNVMKDQWAEAKEMEGEYEALTTREKEVLQCRIVELGKENKALKERSSSDISEIVQEVNRLKAENEALAGRKEAENETPKETIGMTPFNSPRPKMMKKMKKKSNR